MSDERDNSYPYTYAAKYIVKELGPHADKLARSGEVPVEYEKEPNLTLADADRLLLGICKAGNLNYREVAIQIAEVYLKKYGRY